MIRRRGALVCIGLWQLCADFGAILSPRVGTWPQPGTELELVHQAGGDTTVPIGIGAGRSPFADLGELLKLEVVEEERFQSGALAQILIPNR